MRIAEVVRKTGETNVSLTLNLDGTGQCKVDCPIGFFNHMLTSFCKHGLFDLSGKIEGDLDVDQHHLIEDTGIVLGQAFAKALAQQISLFLELHWILKLLESYRHIPIRGKYLKQLP